ncbi:MAG: dynamin family protein [Firmicutes bacterium]|nr:dynamin family protein [Bacillota bacterium]
MSEILEKCKKAYELLSGDEACRGYAEQVAQLIDKLENNAMTVSIIGQFKRGKSSLSNAILEDTILPVGIVPITSAVTKVVYSEKKSAHVHFKNGAVEEVGLDELSRYISEQENKGNELGVEMVVLGAPSKFLQDGMEFVDTPGVGSFHKNNTEAAYEYMKESDGVIFLLSVDSPINQIEIDFLRNTNDFAGRFYFAVNKTDTVAPADLQAYIDYCRMILCELMGTDDIKIFPVSAKTGEGIEELKTTVLADCRSNAQQILEESAEKKLREIVSQSLKQLDFYWKAMNMPFEELDERFAAVQQTIEEIKETAAGRNAIFELYLNEIKLQLSARILELFGMEYHYNIKELPAGMVTMNKNQFLKQVDEICDDLVETLNRILLYREENAYTVVRRINAINRLTRSLKRL